MVDIYIDFLELISVVGLSSKDSRKKRGAEENLAWLAEMEGRSIFGPKISTLFSGQCMHGRQEGAEVTSQESG